MKALFTPDRRSAARLAGSGQIELRFANPAPSVITAELVESSTSGFRAAHESGEIVVGLELDFRGNRSKGRARVIWTHVLGTQRVSGFLIL
jgi:hypothetical protein